jgi:type II secretory pathway pseudopilin PulG
MTRRTTQRKGFSLVELLIAFFVLLVGILAVLVLFPLGLRESKTMVDASMASFVARNARSLMETHPFTYHSGGSSKDGFGTASRVQILFGPRGTKGNITMGSFPVMFPQDVLGSNQDTTFPLKADYDADPNKSMYAFYRPGRTVNTIYDLCVSTSNPQYSWDARFTVGGGPGLTPPPGGVVPFDMNDVQYWFVQYFKYYAVQISVYRNHDTLRKDDGTDVMAGNVWVRASKRQDGSDYDTDDPNRPLYSELVLTSAPPADLVVDSHVRIRDDKSDWYRVTSVSYDAGNHEWKIRFDRPYASKIDPATGRPELDMTGVLSASRPKSNIIATNSLIESFTTILASQLDDIDTSQVSYP